MVNKLKTLPVEELEKNLPDTINEVLGVRITHSGDDFIEAKMPVKNARPGFEFLTNGSMVVLSETIGSIGASLTIDNKKFRCLGLAINVNHIAPVTNGFVTATAKPLSIDGSTQVWEIRIKNEENTLVCISRLTVAVVSLS